MKLLLLSHNNEQQQSKPEENKVRNHDLFGRDKLAGKNTLEWFVKKISEDIALQNREFLQTFVWWWLGGRVGRWGGKGWGSSAPPPYKRQ